MINVTDQRHDRQATDDDPELAKLRSAFILAQKDERRTRVAMMAARHRVRQVTLDTDRRIRSLLKEEYVAAKGAYEAAVILRQMAERAVRGHVRGQVARVRAGVERD